MAFSVKPPKSEPKSEESNKPDDEQENTAKVAESTEAIFSSSPIARFKIGPFRFEKSLLRLSDPAEIEQLEKLIAAGNLGQTIKRVDVTAAEELIRRHLNQGGMTKQIDSSVGRMALENEAKLAPTLGTDPVE